MNMHAGIIILIIIFLLYITSVRYRLKRHEYFSKIPLFTDNFTTGDIIIMNGDSLYPYYNYSWYLAWGVVPYLLTGNFATHCGVVIVYDKPYIYHITGSPLWDDYKKEYVNNGPIFQDVYKYITEYSGYVTVYKAPRPIKPAELIFNDNFEYTMYPFHRILDFMFAKNKFSKEIGIYCYEHTAHVLQISNPRSMLSNQLVDELYERKYDGPYICNNLYTKYIHWY